MPQRTTPFQMIIHFVRQHWSGPGVTATESKLLHDAHLGIDREVDVVVEGSLDGEPIIISFEVIEHGRPASITWTEQIIKKHEHLPTNRLVLISKSGFSKAALAAVAAEGGRVDALRPEFVDVDGQSSIASIYVDQIQLRPTICRLHVIHPDGDPMVVEITPDADINVFNREGEVRGTAFQLAAEILNRKWMMEKFMRDAHTHAERDELKGFSCMVTLESLGYYLRADETKTLHPLLAVELMGEFSFGQSEMAFTKVQLAERQFGMGEGLILGKPGVWVKTFNDETKEAKISWRTGPGAPGVPPAPGETAVLFPELGSIPQPEEWKVENPPSSAFSSL